MLTSNVWIDDPIMVAVYRPLLMESRGAILKRLIDYAEGSNIHEWSAIQVIFSTHFQ